MFQIQHFHQCLTWTSVNHTFPDLLLRYFWCLAFRILVSRPTDIKLNRQYEAITVRIHMLFHNHAQSKLTQSNCNFNPIVSTIGLHENLQRERIIEGRLWLVPKIARLWHSSFTEPVGFATWCSCYRWKWIISVLLSTSCFGKVENEKIAASSWKQGAGNDNEIVKVMHLRIL